MTSPGPLIAAVPALQAPAAIVGLLIIAAAVFVGAVWFGLRIVAPRLGRTVDRMDADDHDEDAG